jgi:hypothetical protein
MGTQFRVPIFSCHWPFHTQIKDGESFEPYLHILFPPLAAVCCRRYRHTLTARKDRRTLKHGRVSRKVHKQKRPLSQDKSRFFVCLVHDKVVLINNKAEPVPNGEQVRIILVWWTVQDSNFKSTVLSCTNLH